jgi:hypothetical protein
MSLKKTRFIKGIILAPDSVALDGIEGEIKVDSSTGKILVTLKDGVNPSASREIVTSSQSQTLTNKSIDADSNIISNLETENLKSGVLNTSTTLSGASDTQLPSALAVKTYVDNVAAAQNEASEISYSNISSGLTATTVQAAIDEVEARTGTTETDLTNHISDTTDAHDASAISVVPTGNLAADDVQEALQELQTDVDSRALASDLTTHTSASSGVHGVTGSVVGTTDNQTLTTKTIDADNNTISNLEVDNLKSGVLNTSTSLSGASDTQIPSALAVKTYVDAVPSAIIVSQTSFTIANNQSSAANITGLVFDPTLFRGIEIKYSIYRQTDTALSAKAQMGQLRFVYNTQAASWAMSDDYAGQDAGVEFSIDDVSGQIKYISSDITGANYVGTLKYSLTKTFGV